MPNREIFHGVVRGKTIELERDPGLPDGAGVTVTLATETPRRAIGEGIRRSFGAWADDGDELDAYLEWNRRQRKLNSRANGL